MGRSHLLVLLFFCCCAGVLSAETLRVPGDYPGIQAAIDAAADGDTVQVAPGTYLERIDFVGKAILVQGSEQAGETVLDGGRSGSVVTFNQQEGKDSILQGFTLTNGSGTTNLPTGLACGGGVFISEASPVLRNLIFRKNVCQPKAKRGQKVNLGVGGALFCYDSEALIEGCVFLVNSVNMKGGALACGRSRLILDHCTVAGNRASAGGAIYASSESHLTVLNSIFWNNFSDRGEALVLRSGADLVMDYCHIKRGLRGIFAGTGSSVQWGEAMSDKDPLLHSLEKGDCRLQARSPCIGTGTAGDRGAVPYQGPSDNE